MVPRRPKTAPAPVDEAGTQAPGSPFPIVGVGASAGGLEAFTQMLGALPVDTGMAFVLVQHLAPKHASLLAEILARTTAMPVTEVQNEPRVKPNRVYVIPPDRNMVISRGVLNLLPREEARGRYRPIDFFFRSLAEEQGQRAIGVILSGTATDGTLGLEAIKTEGGITFAQDNTAQQSSMPQSAVASGCVDFVLPPDEIAREIGRIARHPYVAPDRRKAPAGEPDLGQILEILRKVKGVDFSLYKANTLYRRITRRMVLHQMQELQDYARFLRKNAGEVESLYQDTLIRVTRFFRNPEAFEALKAKVLPKLLKNRSGQEPLRVWVPGCSTGEEAYSIAIAFAELAAARGSQLPVQVYATDLNEECIDKARKGVYSQNITHDVSPERLRRFFAEVDGSYRISKPIRDMCVFARHNVLTDPPFSQIDLISCRNLLIYLEPALQQKLVERLHYALKPAGFLLLGSSETISSYRALFEAADAKHKIYAKKPGTHRMALGQPAGRYQGRAEPGHGPGRLQPARADVRTEADRILMARYAPPGVLVNAELEILQFRGDTGPPFSRSSMRSSILPRFSPARLTTLSPMTAAVDRTLGWISTVVVMDMMELLVVVTRANPDQSTQCRRKILGVGDNQFEKAARSGPSTIPHLASMLSYRLGQFPISTRRDCRGGSAISSTAHSMTPSCDSLVPNAKSKCSSAARLSADLQAAAGGVVIAFAFPEERPRQGHENALSHVRRQGSRNDEIDRKRGYAAAHADVVQLERLGSGEEIGVRVGIRVDGNLELLP
jgi:two-component system CheB/CheR fusion protein